MATRCGLRSWHLTVMIVTRHLRAYFQHHVNNERWVREDGIDSDTCLALINVQESRKTCLVESQCWAVILLPHPMVPASADELMAAASGARPALAAQEGHQGWLRRCVEATLKGVAIGSGLKGSLALLSALVRLRRLLTGKSKSFSLAVARKRRLLRWLFNLHFWCGAL